MQITKSNKDLGPSPSVANDFQLQEYGESTKKTQICRKKILEDFLEEERGNKFKNIPDF